MADYKALRGFTIQTVAGDPSNLILGQVWYDSAAKKVQGAKLAAGAWASGTSAPTARESGGGAGIQTAALLFGGTPSPAGDVTEEYDGSSWTAGGDLNTGGYDMAGFGTQTAAFAINRYPANAAVETYDGSSWTEGPSINTARDQATGYGTTTAGLISGGRPNRDIAEQWNGSAWSEVGDLNTGRSYVGGFGTSAAANMVGPNVHESWDDSSWTETTDLNTTRNSNAGSGTQTAGITFGGLLPPATRAGQTETWDGSAWTEEGDLSTGRSRPGASTAAPNVSSLCMSGYAGTAATANAEEWTGAAAAAVTFTSS